MALSSGLDRSGSMNEMTTAFQEADFIRAGVDVRFFGETHSPEAPHLFSWFIELDSEDAASSARDWLEADTRKPCPHSCAARVNSFNVEGIPDARGVHRIAEQPRTSRQPGSKTKCPMTATGSGSPFVRYRLHGRSAWAPRSIVTGASPGDRKHLLRAAHSRLAERNAVRLPQPRRRMVSSISSPRPRAKPRSTPIRRNPAFSRTRSDAALSVAARANSGRPVVTERKLWSAALAIPLPQSADRRIGHLGPAVDDE